MRSCSDGVANESPGLTVVLGEEDVVKTDLGSDLFVDPLANEEDLSVFLINDRSAAFAGGLSVGDALGLVGNNCGVCDVLYRSLRETAVG